MSYLVKRIGLALGLLIGTIAANLCSVGTVYVLVKGRRKPQSSYLLKYQLINYLQEFHGFS